MILGGMDSEFEVVAADTCRRSQRVVIRPGRIGCTLVAWLEAGRMAKSSLVRDESRDLSSCQPAVGLERLLRRRPMTPREGCPRLDDRSMLFML